MKRKVICLLESNNITLQISMVCGITIYLSYIMGYEMNGMCV